LWANAGTTWHGFRRVLALVWEANPGLTLALALLVPFEQLAEGTSLATLLVFLLVNLSLLRLRHR